MIINKKLYLARVNKRMSRAELAYKTEHSISEIKAYETNGTPINAYTLLKILNTLEIKIKDFQDM